MRKDKRFTASNGFATLTITLILITITSLLVITATQIQILGLQESGNERQYKKQFLNNQSLLDAVSIYIEHNYDQINWSVMDKEYQHSILLPKMLNLTTPLSTASELNIVLQRKHTSPKTIYIEIETKNINDQTMKTSVAIRAQGILTPFGENAPPLMINGCILSTQGDIEIYPDNTISDPDSILVTADIPCNFIEAMDLHDGHISEIDLEITSLWETVFSISREEFNTLTIDEEILITDITQRRRMIAKPEELVDGSWNTSLGTAEAPAILLFPESLGCPEIHSGVVVTGIVIYEGDCATNLLSLQGTIRGTLIINNDAHLEGSMATLEHISHSSTGNKLLFPVTHAPQLPGTWIDY